MCAAAETAAAAAVQFLLSVCSWLPAASSLTTPHHPPKPHPLQARLPPPPAPPFASLLAFDEASNPVGAGPQQQPQRPPSWRERASLAVFPYAGLAALVPTAAGSAPPESVLSPTPHRLGEWRAPRDVPSVQFAVVLPVTAQAAQVRVTVGGAGYTRADAPVVSVAVGSSLTDLSHHGSWDTATLAASQPPPPPQAAAVEAAAAAAAADEPATR